MNDFAFLEGRWRVHNRFLNGRLCGSTEWVEFDGTSHIEPVLNGLGNVDRYTAVRDGRTIEGLTLRLFDPATRKWALYWADNVRAGRFLPPMIGSFHGNVGEFYGDEEVDGRRILCRFLWTADERSPRWEQAFSADDGKTWETNWIMTFTRPEQG